MIEKYTPPFFKIIDKMVLSPLAWLNIVGIGFNLFLLFTLKTGFWTILNIVAIICFSVSMFLTYESTKSTLRIEDQAKEIRRLEKEIIEELRLE